MIIIYGRYRFCPKRVSVRKDFCNCCEQERLTERYRTFDFLHLYWIPLIPFGFHQHWHCVECSLDPRIRYRTSVQGLFRTFKILVAMCVSVLILISFLLPDAVEDPQRRWGIRISLMFAFIGLIYWIVAAKGGGDLLNHAKRDAVVPLNMEKCVYCNGALTNDGTTCAACDVQIYR